MLRKFASNVVPVLQARVHRSKRNCTYNILFRPMSSMGDKDGRRTSSLKDLLKLAEDDLVSKVPNTRTPTSDCGDDDEFDEDDEDELEDMFVEGPAGIEWNGPTRGGARPEPTRFGDWERKGRVSDF